MAEVRRKTLNRTGTRDFLRFYVCITGIVLLISGNASLAQDANQQSRSGRLAISTRTTTSIITQPQDQTTIAGGVAYFSITVDGTAPFSYYWYKNDVLQTSTINTSSTTNLYTTPILSASDNGSVYYCITEGGYSRFANLTISATATAPTCTTFVTSAITQTSATLASIVNPNGTSTVYYFNGGLQSGPFSDTPLQTANSLTYGQVCNYPLTGLTPNTTYIYHVVATNSGGTSYGIDRTFTTLPTAPVAPTITTTTATNITGNSASSGGNVTSDGGATVTARGVCWSTTSNPTTSNFYTSDGTGTGTFTSSITGLSLGTQYYYRAYATNSAGTAYGSELTFTTSVPVVAPTITTTTATSITSTGATSGGNVTADGGATVIARGVCWSTSSNPTTANSYTSDGAGTGSFTSSITGLSSGTLYHYRAYATNSAGTSYGSDLTFTTTSSTPTITVSTNSLPDFGNVIVGQNSTSQSYTVSGSNLIANIAIQAPTGFQVSLSSISGFASSLNLTQSGGTVSNTTIYAIFSPTSTGFQSGNISHISTGATTKNVSISGTGTAASTPTITSFTPTSGPIGTTVTISGTNFNTTASNNIVYFGAVRATINTASDTIIIVKVPQGATYAPISITDITTGLTGYSAQSFTLTFPSSCIIDNNSFAPWVRFSTGNYTYSIACGDLDGDGMPDLAAINYGSNTVSVFRNTNESGTVSFATKVDFTTGSGPYSIAIGDIDCDGKPDLVIANKIGNTVSVFMNVSTSGTVGFAARVDFNTGNSPRGVAIGDVDGNGKPDMVVVNNGSNSVSILRNISTSGKVNFASKVDLTTGNTPTSVAMCDVNGDGKLDIIVTNNGSNNISVFQNNSTSGMINFATQNDFTTANGPAQVTVGDVDGDGKLDILVTNNISNNVSVFRNNSSGGTVSFAYRADFTATSGPLGICIGDMDGDAKPDMAVVNNGFNYVSVFRNTSVSGTINFASKVDFATAYYGDENAFSVTLCDIDGNGKPDLAVASSWTNVGFISILANKITPQAPQNLIAIAGDGQVALKWNRIEENRFLRYRIYMNTSANASTLKDSTLQISDTVKNIIGLTNGTRYYFRITAVDSSLLESKYSNEVPIIPTVLPPLDPKNLTAVAGNGRVTLKWNRNTESDFLRYRIYRSNSPSATMKVDSTTGGITDTIKVITGLTNDTSYYFRITAMNNSGLESAYSNEVSSMPSATITLPASPTNLAATAVSSSKINLTWTDNSTNEDGFKIEQKSGAGAYTEVANVSAGITSYQNTGLAGSTLYFYQVRAFNTAGNSSYSNEASATTPSSSDVSAPAAPINPIITPSGWTNNSSFTISWTNPSDPSGISRIWFTYNIAPSSGNLGTSIAATINGSNGTVTIPSPGTTGIHTLYFYLEDGATPGNKNPNAYATVSAKVDVTLPAIQHDSLAVSTFEISSPQAIGIQTTATDAHSGMKTLQLQYKRAGLGWLTVSTVNYPNSGGGVASIPIVDISSYAKYGVDYRIIATDSAGNIGYTPTHSLLIHTNATVTHTDAFGNPVTQIGVSTLPTGTSTEYAYRLFSVPLSLENRTPYDVLENRTGLGAYDVKKWRFFRWDTTSGDFEDYPGFANAQIITPDVAFFLIIKSGAVIKVGPGSIVKSDEFSNNGLPLKMGYNFVGNPFGFDVPMDSLGLADGTSLLNKTWSFVGVGGTNAGWQPNPLMLKSWEGIVIKLTAPNTLRFNIADRPHASIHPAASVRRMENVDSTKLWMVRIKAIRTDNAVTDEENLFGISGDIQPSLCEPPMVGEKSVSLSFDSPDGAITHDFRSASDSGWVWDFRVATPDVGSKVQLKFENIERAGNGYLLDKTSKMVYKLQEVTDLKTTTIKGGCEYRIIVGSKEFADANNLGIDLEPKSFTLYQNYPNPFNPSTTIRYSLTEPSHVKLTIYDVLGREIAVLLNGEVTAGYREVEWRAMVSTGIYFYHLETVSIDNPQHRFVETRKMVLMR